MKKTAAQADSCQPTEPILSRIDLFKWRKRADTSLGSPPSQAKDVMGQHGELLLPLAANLRRKFNRGHFLSQMMKRVCRPKEQLLHSGTAVSLGHKGGVCRRF
ncbi:hypothetical protein BPS26883_00562 [Burkholderia pseudomultivorans]|uniref:Uncharacterized protein n=1 Tax=Burkholderia pseudomultivorans TaxID=1207504 RepID=A0A6P2HFG4_9BURK|nr:hypothetical protein BPS26883_00562 [Burkholderia pseudomultivorans]